MPAPVLEQYATTLTRTFMSRTASDARPRTVFDVTDKGDEVLEFILPNPGEPRHALSLSVSVSRGKQMTATLRFGQAEIASNLSEEDAISAIGEVLDGHIVVITRYKNRDAFDDRRLVSSGQTQWLYQMPDSTDELARMIAKLQTKASFTEKLSGKLIGVFEVYAWERREIIER